jgi:tRNA-splicing ligase RtcB (3'-phosphate/5'-hydroxy nucleic acid ligase)
MYQIKGKYGIINIMTNEKEIEKEIHDNLQKLINYHMFKNSYISIMPDYHLGVGSVIGFTMKMNDYIIPNIIGVD